MTLLGMMCSFSLFTLATVKVCTCIPAENEKSSCCCGLGVVLSGICGHCQMFAQTEPQLLTSSWLYVNSLCAKLWSVFRVAGKPFFFFLLFSSFRCIKLRVNVKAEMCMHIILVRFRSVCMLF